MGILGMAEGAENGLRSAGASISANAGAFQAIVSARQVSAAHAQAQHQAHRAASANHDFYEVVALLAQATAENARLRAALDESDDENAHLSEVIGDLRARLHS